MNFSTVIYLLGSGSTKSGQDIDLENVFFSTESNLQPEVYQQGPLSPYR